MEINLVDTMLLQCLRAEYAAAIARGDVTAAQDAACLAITLWRTKLH